MWSRAWASRSGEGGLRGRVAHLRVLLDHPPACALAPGTEETQVALVERPERPPERSRLDPPVAVDAGHTLVLLGVLLRGRRGSRLIPTARPKPAYHHSPSGPVRKRTASIAEKASWTGEPVTSPAPSTGGPCRCHGLTAKNLSLSALRDGPRPVGRRAHKGVATPDPGQAPCERSPTRRRAYRQREARLPDVLSRAHLLLDEHKHSAAFGTLVAVRQPGGGPVVRTSPARSGQTSGGRWSGGTTSAGGDGTTRSGGAGGAGSGAVEIGGAGCGAGGAPGASGAGAAGGNGGGVH